MNTTTAGIASFKLTHSDRRRIVSITLAVIVAIACLPLLLSYIPYNASHDLVFHLYRIDGVAEGLRMGQFPVRMQTSQMNGLGYPVSICYGDLFLYIPAMLRVFGLSTKASYSIFVLLINTCCTLITYIVTRRMTESRSIALVASALWTWNPYRLLDDVWLRAAVGEYLALTFFPVVLYGMYSIFLYRQRGASRLGWLWCAAGISGVVYSHIISVLLLVVTFVPMSILLFIHHHDKRVLKSMALAIGTTLLLCLAFVVPFLDYYLGVDMKVTAGNVADKRNLAAANALQPAQLLLFLPPVTSFSAAGNTVNEMPFTVGWAGIIGILLWLTCLCIPSIRNRIPRRPLFCGIALMLLGLLLAFVTTVYFPWIKPLGRMLDAFIGIIATIQFPWRFVGPLSFVVLMISVLALVFLRRLAPAFFYGASIATMAVAAIEVTFGLSSFMINAAALPSNYHEVDSSGVMVGEYLLATVDISTVLDLPTRPVPSNGVHVTDFNKQGTSIRLDVDAPEGGEVTLPLFAYPHYEAMLSDDSPTSMDSDEHGLLVVHVPQDYTGTIFVEFSSPLLWRIAEVISLITLVLCALASYTGISMHKHQSA